MKTLSDAELVARTRNGDRQAFGHLAERYQQLALAIAAGMVGDRDIVRELVQEAMMQAYLSLKTLRHPDRFRAWLLVVVRNLCRTYLSNRKDPGLSLDVLLRGEHRVDSEGFHSVCPNPYQETEDRDLYRRILEAVNALSEKKRTATLLFYYERFSHREIADHLGVSIAAVKSALFRARNQLADLLAPVCPEFAAPKPRSKPMIELTVADVVPLSLEDYYAVLLLDKEGGRILPMTVANRTSALIQESMRQARDRSSPSDRAKVLVVDDANHTRELLCRLMSNVGYEVLEANNGRAALERIERESPDLVLLDIFMPDMSGFEVLRWIKAKQAHAAIPAILAISGSTVCEKVLEAGADDFMAKPFRFDDLKDRVESLLDMHQKDKAYQIPGAYDFAVELLNGSGVVLDEVRLEPLHDTRFIAVARIRNGKEVSEVETWPESAIALAVRTGCPIYASEAVLESAGKPIPEDLGETPEVLLQALTAFVFYQDRAVTDRFRRCIRCACEEARRLNAP